MTAIERLHQSYIILALDLQKNKAQLNHNESNSVHEPVIWKSGGAVWALSNLQAVWTACTRKACPKIDSQPSTVFWFKLTYIYICISLGVVGRNLYICPEISSTVPWNKLSSSFRGFPWNPVCYKDKPDSAWPKTNDFESPRIDGIRWSGNGVVGVARKGLKNMAPILGSYFHEEVCWRRCTFNWKLEFQILTGCSVLQAAWGNKQRVVIQYVPGILLLAFPWQNDMCRGYVNFEGCISCHLQKRYTWITCDMHTKYQNSYPIHESSCHQQRQDFLCI